MTVVVVDVVDVVVVVVDVVTVVVVAIVVFSRLSSGVSDRWPERICGLGLAVRFCGVSQLDLVVACSQRRRGTAFVLHFE